jgi:hypothetical protein
MAVLNTPQQLGHPLARSGNIIAGTPEEIQTQSLHRPPVDKQMAVETSSMKKQMLLVRFIRYAQPSGTGCVLFLKKKKLSRDLRQMKLQYVPKGDTALGRRSGRNPRAASEQIAGDTVC